MWVLTTAHNGFWTQNLTFSLSLREDKVPLELELIGNFQGTI